MHSLEKENKDLVRSEIKDATTVENRTKIREEYGFKTHGLVISAPDGTVLEKLDGHFLEEPEMRAALERALHSESAPGS